MYIENLEQGRIKVAGKLREVNQNSFKKDVLKSDVPVLLDFWAEWCMPCRMIAPFVEELAEEYKGKVEFAKVDVDNNTQLATELQILSIPALILFKNGREIKRIIGANPKDAIKNEIDSALQEN